MEHSWLLFLVGGCCATVEAGAESIYRSKRAVGEQLFRRIIPVLHEHEAIKPQS